PGEFGGDVLAVYPGDARPASIISAVRRSPVRPALRPRMPPTLAVPPPASLAAGLVRGWTTCRRRRASGSDDYARCSASPGASPRPGRDAVHRGPGAGGGTTPRP